MAFVYTAIAGGVLALVVALQRRRLRDTIERTAMLVRTRGANVAEIERIDATTDSRTRRPSRSARSWRRLALSAR